MQEDIGRKLSRPLYIERGTAAESLIADPAMRGSYASYWSFPMGTVALVQFGFAVPYPWLPRELAVLDAVGERCREAIERARMEEEIRRLEAESRQSRGRGAAADRPRTPRRGRAIAAAAAAAIGDAGARSAGGPAATAGTRLARWRRERSSDLRRIVAALSPAVLERLGLGPAVRQLGARFRKMHPADLRLRISVPSAPLPMAIQQVIYRVAQECLQNIAKHSQATHVNLSLRAADKSIRLSVSDNGAGFSAETVGNKPMSFGLAGMRERAAILGGTSRGTKRAGQGRQGHSPATRIHRTGGTQWQRFEFY